MKNTKKISKESHLNFLNNMRKYLTIVSELDYKLTEQMQKVINELKKKNLILI